MSATAPEKLSIERHDGAGLRARKDEVLTVYLEVYAERLDDPFFYPERFSERLDAYAARDSCRLVTGRVNGELVGFTVGSILAADTGWWHKLKADVDAEFVRETGSRTFGINELQVRPDWRRRGYARAMSTALLEGLPVERAVLTVRPENILAVTAYKSWGFYVIGQKQPFADSPVYDVMVKDF